MPRLIDADELEFICAGPFVQTYKEARKAIKDAPTVDAEPVRHGRWLECTGLDGGVFVLGCTYYKCSLCGRVEEENSEPYCHCGAKMNGGHNDK